ncbi:MAG: sigma-54-dependent Fis family transcriptional regulator, partial [Planctomycetes bacterium]|nr:sigma-54-dependent Fis family transcriptional regulator [Planctomycetota bacterium]
MSNSPNHRGLAHRRVLVVDDELALRKGLAQRFEEEGAEVTTADNVATARKALKEGDFDLAVLDHRLPDGTGLALLEEQKRAGCTTTFLMMTAYSSTADAVRAMKSGAADYLQKPFDLDELMLVAERALESVALRTEVTRLRSRQTGAAGVAGIVGRSAAMAELRGLVQQVAASGARTILITGESGTGKDVVAHAIHAASPEADRPFLDITCTALPEALLESELFGHERGAFTDAKTSKRGLFEEADGGTIFLDEIGDMPLSLQAKLLRFLEAKSFRRVGGLREIKVDVRVIAATHRRLPELIEKGQFRGDLYYR